MLRATDARHDPTTNGHRLPFDDYVNITRAVPYALGVKSLKVRYGNSRCVMAARYGTLYTCRGVVHGAPPPAARNPVINAYLFQRIIEAVLLLERN